MRSWDIRAIEASGGIRTPTVLHSDDARAIVVSLRHPIASADGARLLLLLAPWPAEGHHPDG